MNLKSLTKEIDIKLNDDFGSSEGYLFTPAFDKDQDSRITYNIDDDLCPIVFIQTGC